MSDMVSVIHRFAGHEFLVRRLYVIDPEFRIICDDYAVALRASEVWANDEIRSEDYQSLVRELEEEIFHYIDEARPATR
jgi:hypothetical protein